MLKIILVGPPGVGKGTQGELLGKKFKIPLISTGNMLRSLAAEDTHQGRRLSQIMDRGELIDDAFMIDLVKTRLMQDDASLGYILDGFPRTVNQAEQLEKAGIIADFVIHYSLGDNEIISRLSGRLVHPASGRTYHEIANPPKIAGQDDLTGDDLVRRDDDHSDVIAQRLRVYRKKTEPLLNYYINHTKINYKNVVCQDKGIPMILKEVDGFLPPSN